MDEEGFVVEDVTKIVKDAIETIIGGNYYQHEKVHAWSNAISDTSLVELSKLDKQYKFVVQCTITQKTGAGLHTACACYWDNNTDGICTVRWENKSMYCIVSVFGFAI